MTVLRLASVCLRVLDLWDGFSCGYLGPPFVMSFVYFVLTWCGCFDVVVWLLVGFVILVCCSAIVVLLHL